MHNRLSSILLTSIIIASCGGGGGGGSSSGGSGGGYGEGGGSGGGSGSTNTAPELTGVTNYSIPENTTSITTIQANDAENNTLTFTLTGADASLFSIGAYSGALAFRSAPNFEQPQSASSDNTYNLSVSVSDGSLSDSQSFSVEVQDANDAPNITSSATFNAAENQSAIDTVTATDEDGDTLSFSISGNEIAISNSGVLTFVALPDYETKSTYTATVTVTDGSTPVTQNITVNVTDVDENNTNNANEIFISEYAEGSSYNKYIEIFNATGETVNLNDYAFPTVGNDPTTSGEHEYWNEFTSGATLANNSIYIVCHPQADAQILDKCDQTYQYFSNGNDGLKLVKGIETNFTVIDTLGDWKTSGIPNGTGGWAVCGEDNATLNGSLIKKDGVEGNPDWDDSRGTNADDCDWKIIANEDWSDIDKHTWNGSSTGGSGGGGSGGGGSGGGGSGGGGSGGGGSGGGTTIPDGETELYIPEYADVESLDGEGLFGNTKYIEIYNPYSEAVDLSGYTLKGISNAMPDTWGSGQTSSGRVLELSGTIGSKDVYLITGVDSVQYGDIDDYVVSQADLQLEYESPVHVNGDDAVGLFKGDTLLDTVGQPEATDIGKGWDACGVTAATYKHTLIKKEGKTGSSDWATSAGTNADDCHWIVKDEGYFEDAGIHLQEVKTLTAATGKFYIDGIEKPQLYFVIGKTYKIDTSDTSNANHPIFFGDSTEYETTQTFYGEQIGTPGTAGSYYILEVTSDLPSVIYYFCKNHVGMGNSVTISAVANEEPELEFPTKVYSSLVQGFGRVNYMYSDEIIKNDILEVTATDADNDALSFSLSGTDASSFNISTTGSLSFKNTPDFDQKDEYSVNIVVSDGKSNISKSLVVFIDRFCTDTLLGLSVCIEDEKSYDGSYNRDRDYDTWHDWDGDCQNNRQEVLISENLPGNQITFTAASGTCTVATGKWYSKFNDKEYTSASDVSIDHMVPLSESHYSGAWKWSQKRKLIFANSINLDEHLIAVYGDSNSEKSNCSPGPNSSWSGKQQCGPNGDASSEAKETWMPENTAYACEYLEDYVKVKSHYRLGIDATEKANIESQYSENSCSN